MPKVEQYTICTRPLAHGRWAAEVVPWGCDRLEWVAGFSGDTRSGAVRMAEAWIGGKLAYRTRNGVPCTQ